MLQCISAIAKRLLFFVPAPIINILSFEFISFFMRRFTRLLLLDTSRRNYINMGSGPFVVAGLINIDFFFTAGIDYGADLRYPLKIGSETVDGIFIEHTLEHLTYSEAGHLLAECYRILKPAGVIRIVLPDLSLFINNYSSGNDEWFAAWERLMFTHSSEPERARRRLASPLEAISFVTQEYGHKSSWDFHTLKAYLEKAGFLKVMETVFRQGEIPELLIDLDEEDRKFVSFYVEAVK